MAKSNPATLVATEHDPAPPGAHAEWLRARDGTSFRVARFSGSDTSRGTAVILNGRTEFIEKYFETIGDLLERGYAVATLDWRGQGQSDRALENPHKGHVADFDLYVGDLQQAFVSFIEPNCPAPYRAVCHSMGGNIGLRYVAEYPGTFESVVFSAPMWGIGKRARPAAWMRGVIAATGWFGLHERYPPGGRNYHEDDRNFEKNVLTQDQGRFARFVAQTDAEPALRLGSPTLGWALEAFRSMDAIHAPGFAEAIETPICVCSAGRDSLVSGEAHQRVAERLPQGRLVEVPDARHELLMELDRHRDRFWAAFDAM